MFGSIEGVKLFWLINFTAINFSILQSFLYSVLTNALQGVLIPSHQRHQGPEEAKCDTESHGKIGSPLEDKKIDRLKEWRRRTGLGLKGGGGYLYINYINFSRYLLISVE